MAETVQGAHAMLYEELVTVAETETDCKRPFSLAPDCIAPPTLPEQTVWERKQNSPFFIRWSVFHQESFKIDPTIGWPNFVSAMIHTGCIMVYGK